MKKVLFFVAVLGTIFTVKAQSISTIYNGNTIAEGDTIVVTTAELEPVVRPNFHNNTDAAINAISRCETVTSNGMSVSAMCAGQCQQGNVSPQFSIDPNTTYTGLFADFIIEENVQNGTAGLFKFVTYNVADTTDATKVYVKLVYSKTDITAVATAKELNVYPNPSSNQITIQYILPEGNTTGKIVLYNLLGCVVREITVSEAQGTVQFNVSSLPAGIYLYGMVVSDKQSSLKKVAIR